MASYGFASAVASDLIQRARAYNAAHLTTWAAWVEPRVALMQDLAVLLAGKGDRDDLVGALGSFEGGRWNPGRRVERLLTQEVLVVPEPRAPSLAKEDADRCAAAIAKLPNANRLLYRLLVAYLGDIVDNARQVRDRAAAELAAAKPDAQIESLQRRVAVAEQGAAQAIAETERARAAEARLMRENGLMRAELRLTGEQLGADDPDGYVYAVLAGLAPEKAPESPPARSDTESVAPVPDDPPLPPGVRRRGNGRFHAYLTRAETQDGKQRGVGTFDTVEEAEAARLAALQEAQQEAPERVAA